MACNGMFGAGEGSMISPPNLDRHYTLSMCEVAIFSRKAYNLLREVEFLHDIAKVSHIHINYITINIDFSAWKLIET